MMSDKSYELNLEGERPEQEFNKNKALTRFAFSISNETQCNEISSASYNHVQFKVNILLNKYLLEVFFRNYHALI